MYCNIYTLVTLHTSNIGCFFHTNQKPVWTSATFNQHQSMWWAYKHVVCVVWRDHSWQHHSLYLGQKGKNLEVRKRGFKLLQWETMATQHFALPWKQGAKLLCKPSILIGYHLWPFDWHLYVLSIFILLGWMIGVVMTLGKCVMILLS